MPVSPPWSASADEKVEDGSGYIEDNEGSVRQLRPRV